MKPFVTLTSLHALLNRGSMFVLSSRHLGDILKGEGKVKNVVDLGAGDGKVTQKIAKFAGLESTDVAVTEVSPTMKYRLQQRGFNLLPTDDWHKNQQYDVISMLNLLDRCEKPFTILAQVKQSLAKDGKLLLASVLPFRQSIEWRNDRKPDEVLHVNRTWPIEEQVSYLVEKVIEPCGFDLQSVSRVPYLCEGDVKAPYYVLNNLVMVFKHSNGKDDG